MPANMIPHHLPGAKRIAQSSVSKLKGQSMSITMGDVKFDGVVTRARFEDGCIVTTVELPDEFGGAGV